MRPKRRASIPLGLAGMLLLVAGVESGVSRYVARSFRFESSWVWDATRRQARSGNEILCFGDSQIKNGVLPAAIEARLGRKAYNFAQNGSQVPALISYFAGRSNRARSRTPSSSASTPPCSPGAATAAAPAGSASPGLATGPTSSAIGSIPNGSPRWH